MGSIFGSLRTDDFFKAVKEGDLNAVNRLLASGVSVNARGDDGYTPLHFAALYGHQQIVKLLISKGAKVNAKSSKGLTPLHGAAGAGHRYIVELLISKGADVNARKKDGETPLRRGIAIWQPGNH